ncbi:hypothetical protein RUA8715_03253 [Ruegeria arenilitoris]|uniref:Uncharacterized protein n=1 Tax=Ruegeria arenilitoris TaxID=1173585 RepID=A0A238KZ33_9RHOB|nr:hypothetical protein RUA8715_03253 [Ruegeria arenilitoris]
MTFGVPPPKTLPRNPLNIPGFSPILPPAAPEERTT